MAHLLDVASVAIKHGGTEDEVVAALLHDTLEDGDNPRKIRASIRDQFGVRVLTIVEACTDTTAKKKPEWLTRKARYIVGISKKSTSGKLVSACDKVANLTDMIEDYRRDGAKLWDRFNADREDILWYYNSCAKAFEKGKGNRRLKPLLRLLRERIGTLSEMSA